jgi:lysyl-tRNA synthetase class 2
MRLGVDPYPRQFERADTIDALVEAHSPKTGEQLDAEPVATRTAGRILAIRAFGKANFLVIPDGKAKIQVYVRQDPSGISRSTSCSTSGTSSASKGSCSARRPTS